MMKQYFIPVILFSILSSPLFAQEEQQIPIPAYEGCTFAWDYSEEQAHLVDTFGIHVEGRAGSIAVGKVARSLSCDMIARGTYGIQTWKIRAWNKNFGHSPFASILVDYQPKPQMLAPSNITIQLEWKVPTTENP